MSILTPENSSSNSLYNLLLKIVNKTKGLFENFLRIVEFPEGLGKSKVKIFWKNPIIIHLHCSNHDFSFNSIQNFSGDFWDEYFRNIKIQDDRNSIKQNIPMKRQRHDVVLTLLQRCCLDVNNVVTMLKQRRVFA